MKSLPPGWGRACPIALAHANASLSLGHAAGLAAEKAERLDEGWSERALEWLRFYAATAQLPTGELEAFTVEQARKWIGELAALPEGVDARAWGAVTRRAVRLGYIEATGGYAPAARSHGSPKRLYRRGSRA